MATTHPHTWDVQTPRGISPASVDDACVWLLVREDELVTLLGACRFQPWARTLWSTRKMEWKWYESVLLPSWYEGSTRGADVSCQTRTMRSAWLGTWEPANALCT